MAYPIAPQDNTQVDNSFLTIPQILQSVNQDTGPDNNVELEVTNGDSTYKFKGDRSHLDGYLPPPTYNNGAVAPDYSQTSPGSSAPVAPEQPSQAVNQGHVDLFNYIKDHNNPLTQDHVDLANQALLSGDPNAQVMHTQAIQQREDAKAKTVANQVVAQARGDAKTPEQANINMGDALKTGGSFLIHALGTLAFGSQSEFGKQFMQDFGLGKKYSDPTFVNITMPDGSVQPRAIQYERTQDGLITGAIDPSTGKPITLEKGTSISPAQPAPKEIIQHFLDIGEEATATRLATQGLSALTTPAAPVAAPPPDTTKPAIPNTTNAVSATNAINPAFQTNGVGRLTKDQREQLAKDDPGLLNDIKNNRAVYDTATGGYKYADGSVMYQHPKAQTESLNKLVTELNKASPTNAEDQAAKADLLQVISNPELYSNQDIKQATRAVSQMIDKGTVDTEGRKQAKEIALKNLEYQNQSELNKQKYRQDISKENFLATGKETYDPVSGRQVTAEQAKQPGQAYPISIDNGIPKVDFSKGTTTGLNLTEITAPHAINRAASANETWADKEKNIVDPTDAESIAKTALDARQFVIEHADLIGQLRQSPAWQTAFNVSGVVPRLENALHEAYKNAGIPKDQWAAYDNFGSNLQKVIQDSKKGIPSSEINSDTELRTFSQSVGNVDMAPQALAASLTKVAGRSQLNADKARMWGEEIGQHGGDPGRISHSDFQSKFNQLYGSKMINRINQEADSYVKGNVVSANQPANTRQQSTSGWKVIGVK